jgi:hypothetical protein
MNEKRSQKYVNQYCLKQRALLETWINIKRNFINTIVEQ